jgi:DNA-binding NtrC family response regulator
MADLDQHNPPPDGENGPYAGPHGRNELPPRKPGVLVAEDNDLVRSVLEIGLCQRGFAVWLAATGREAIELYHQHHRTIDLVLLDVRLAGLDGPQTWAVLERLNPNLACCFMSGDLGHHTEEDLLRQRAARVFHKPFRLDEVVATLHQLFQQQRQANAAAVGGLAQPAEFPS